MADIDWKDEQPIAGMTPWLCSYDGQGGRFSITLYGTSPDQVIEDNCDLLPGLRVDGRLQATGTLRRGGQND